MRRLQAEIIKALHVKPNIDPRYEIRRRVDFIKEYLEKTHTNTLVLGISGGVDSSLTGKLCEIATTELRKDTGNSKYQFIAVRLPYVKQADESDAMKAVHWMKPDKTVRVNIGTSTDAMTKDVDKTGIKVSDFNQGNIKARERMIAQYAIAGATNGLVVGTDHAAEGIVAFYTKYGDGASDIAPIQGLDKRQVRKLVATLGAPKRLVKKAPTADLESKHPDQVDSVELGTSYQNVDDYLEGKDIDPKVASMLEHKYMNSEHKRRMPVNIYNTFWK